MLYYAILDFHFPEFLQKMSEEKYDNAIMLKETKHVLRQLHEFEHNERNKATRLLYRSENIFYSLKIPEYAFLLHRKFEME